MKITKEQYDFFKNQYEEENNRYSDLIKKSQIYLSLQTLLLSAVFFKIKDLNEILKKTDCQDFMFIFFGVAILQVFISIFYNVLSMKVSKFEGVNNLRDVLSEFTSDSMSDEQFYTNRIVDYTVATGRNAEINDKSAKYLKISTYFLAVGLTCTILFLILIIKF